MVFYGRPHYIYGDIHVSELWNTTDEVLISRVIADDDDDIKINLLISNPNLTEAHLMALAYDANGEVRKHLAWRKFLSAAVLEKLRADEVESVRVQALRHSQSENKFFVEAVLQGKLSGVTKKAFSESVKAVSDFKTFKVLWNAGNRYQVNLMDTLYKATCLTDAPDDPRVLYDTVRYSPPIDPKILELVHETIQSGEASNALKASYACATGVAKPELLDDLKNDPYRPVIEGIAENRSAWVSTHEYLYDKYRTKKLLTYLARATSDWKLLNRIYDGTKSVEIRWYVEHNPAFIPGEN